MLTLDQFTGEITPTPSRRHDQSETARRAVFDRLQRALAGRFSLERELGRGGMAIVYLARDVALDRLVAIKVLPPRLADDSESRSRFLREARTAAGLSHPHIVPIHLVEERDGLVYFVMSYVDGESLGERIRRAGLMKPAEVGRLVQEVAWALGYAHGRGVVHRDIKPDNILLDRGSGRAMVTDFGIARAGGTDDREVLGTVSYVSPEQLRDEGEVDGRSDLYSLGITAFFALTGRLPFESPSRVALLAMHRDDPAPPVRSVHPLIPARLAAVVDRCLVKNPGDRFATGEALAEAVGAAKLTQAEIVPSVREFLGAAKSGVAQGCILGTMWMALGVSGVSELGIAGTGLLVVLTSVTPLVLLNPFFAARGVLRAGLDQRDVAEAAGAHARDANIEYEVARAMRIAGHLSTPWARTLFLAAAVPLGFMLPGAAHAVLTFGASLKSLGILTYLGFAGAAESLFLGLSFAPRKTVAVLTRGTPENAGLLKRLWNGPVGRWLFRLAGIGLPKTRRIAPADSAPTEVLLGRAAKGLLGKLPADQRARLGDVQGIIGTLERAAVDLRARRDELQQALVDLGPSRRATEPDRIRELETARDAVQEQLARAVGALETLRLDLLRLRTGAGHAEELTESIQLARRVGEDVNAELAARQEVDRLIP